MKSIECTDVMPDLPAHLREASGKSHYRVPMYDDIVRVASNNTGKWCEFHIPSLNMRDDFDRRMFVTRVRRSVTNRARKMPPGYRCSVRGDYANDRFYVQFLVRGRADQ